MLTVAVLLLLAGFGSGVAAVTFALLLTGPNSSPVVTPRLIVADAPVASVPSVQITVVVPLHDPCEGVTKTKVTLAGNTSVTLTPVDGPGPLLATVIA